MRGGWWERKTRNSYITDIGLSGSPSTLWEVGGGGQARSDQVGGRQGQARLRMASICSTTDFSRLQMSKLKLSLKRENS